MMIYKILHIAMSADHKTKSEKYLYCEREIKKRTCGIWSCLFESFLRRYEIEKTKRIVYLKENFKQNMPIN